MTARGAETSIDSYSENLNALCLKNNLPSVQIHPNRDYFWWCQEAPNVPSGKV